MNSSNERSAVGCSREEALFILALATPDAERAALLERECGPDGALRARVQALLAAHDQPDTLLDTSAGGDGATPDGDSAPDSAADAVGQTIGRFKLLEKLGEGGCGVVYVAEQTEPVRRRVALKLIKPGMDSREVIARFEAERQALAMMDHPNIARVLEAGTTGCRKSGIASGRPYFVMELVRGVKITDYCDQNRLSTVERVTLFVQVCQAIQHAHQKGIIHRDIKPSNVLVTVLDGVPVPKVIDFGIAKATAGRLTDATVYTRLHQFIGTPAYMSPEQAEMSAVDIDTRGDIYSLGVLLYELLTGRPPFEPAELLAAGFDEMRRTIREREPTRPSTKLAALGEQELTTTAQRRGIDAPRLLRLLRGDLDWIVMKCLEKDRGRRYATANGLAADLRRHLDHEPVVARPPTASYRFRKAWLRHRLAFGTGAVVATALLTSVLVLTWALRDQRQARKHAEAAQIQEGLERGRAEAAGLAAARERDRAARLLSASQAERGVGLLEKHDPTGLVYLLEARRTVEHLPEDRMRRTLLWSGWKDSLPSPAADPVAGTHPTSDSAGSQHGPWVVRGSTNGRVQVHSRRTGDAVAEFRVGSRPVPSPRLSANGRLVAVDSGLSQLWDLAPLESNLPPRRLLGRISRLAFDPAGRRAVTLANQGLPVPGESAPSAPPAFESDGWKVQVWDSEAEPPLVATWDGDRQELMNHQLGLSPDGSKVVAGWHTVSLWEARTGRSLRPQLDTNRVAGARGFFDPLVFSPDGRWLWEVRGNRVYRYDLATGKPVGEVFEGLHRWNRPWVTSDGRFLVLAFDSGFRLADLNQDSEPHALIPRDEVGATRVLAVSADGAHLVTAGADRGIRVWNSRSGDAVGELVVLPSRPTGAGFSADGQSVVVGTVSGRSHTQPLRPPPSSTSKFLPGVRWVGFNANGWLLAHEPEARTLGWVQPDTGAPVSAAWSLPDAGRLLGVALSPDGRTLATATALSDSESRIRFRDAATGALHEPALTWTNIGMLAFSPDGRFLAGLGAYGSVDLWEVSTRELKSHMAWPHPPQVTWLSARFSPDGRFLAARNSYAWSIWDLERRQPATGSDRDFYLAISADWSLALTAQEVLDLADPRSPQPAPRPVTTRSRPQERGGLALSPDNRLRVSTDRLWEIATGRPVGHELKLTGIPLAMEFSPDSRLLVAFERDLSPGPARRQPTLRVWDTSTGLPCGPAHPAEASPIGLAFGVDARWLATLTFPEDRGGQLLRLPERDVPLAEMERRTWLLAGSRMDEAGDLEVLSADEIRQLEAGESSVAGARLQTSGP